MKICDETDGCVGFNTHGWLKKACPNLEVQTSVDTYLDSSSRPFSLFFTFSLCSYWRGARSASLAHAIRVS